MPPAIRIRTAPMLSTTRSCDRATMHFAWAATQTSQQTFPRTRITPRRAPAASCIECHMPATVISLKTRMRDHSMSIPAPENTIRHDIPNACNVCHRDKDAEWTLREMNAWYGEKAGQKLVSRADAFAQARQGDAAAVPELLKLLADPSGGPLIRANAAGYLGSFSNDPSAYDALLHAFTDPEPLVRATAATTSGRARPSGKDWRRNL